MNAVDLVIIAILGLSVLVGLYRGFISSVASMGGCLLSLGLSFWLSPKLAEAIRQCPAPIIASRGNCDSEVDISVLGIPMAAPYAFAFVNGKRVVITHGHLVETQEEKSEMAERLQADIFISGHTHVSVVERVGKTIFLNPGSPAFSKREDGRSTLALMDERHIFIRDLYTGEILDDLSME